MQIEVIRWRSQKFLVGKSLLPYLTLPNGSWFYWRKKKAVLCQAMCVGWCSGVWKGRDCPYIGRGLSMAPLTAMPQQKRREVSVAGQYAFAGDRLGKGRGPARRGLAPFRFTFGRPKGNPGVRGWESPGATPGVWGRSALFQARRASRSS